MGNRAASIRAATAVAHPGATVVERTRRSIKHRVGNQYVYDSAGDLHYDDGGWQEIDTEIVDDSGVFDHQDKDALPFRFKFSDVGRRRIQFDRNRPAEYIEFEPLERHNGVDWQPAPHGTPTRVDNRMQWDGGVNWGVGYRVGATGVKAIYVAKTPLAANDLRWGYSLTGCYRDGNQIKADIDDKVLWTVVDGRLNDSNSRLGEWSRRPVPTVIDATHVTMTPDYTGLQYPVYVDPTVEVSPGASGDDGYATTDLEDWGTADDWILTGCNWWPDSEFEFSVIRFPGVTVPKDATIDVAYIDLERQFGQDDESVEAAIWGLDHDDYNALPTTFANWNTEHTTDHTTASVQWDFQSSNATSGQQTTPSIVSIIEEITTRSGWASGQDIGIHIDDDGTPEPSGDEAKQAWDAYDVSGTPPLLHIEYTDPDATVTPTALVATATLTAPVAAAAATVVATALVATATVGTPTVSAGVGITPTALIATAALTAPILSGSAVVTATAAAATTTIPPPTITNISYVTLYPTGDGTIAGLVNQVDTTVNLYQSIDDDPDSPNDTDYINNHNTDAASGFLDVTDMPAQFVTADSATVVVRYDGENWTSGPLTVYIRFYQADESTPLSDEVVLATVSANSAFANTSEITVTGIVASNKATWDAALARVRIG